MASVNVSLHWDPTFASQLKRDPGVKETLAEAAAEAADGARAIGRSLGGTGAYANTVESVENRVLTTDPAGHIVEWGSVNNPPYAPLRRGVEATGADYKDDT